ncbi:MAG: hypothetical protein A3C81_03070 [Candidatus Yanofskybacteria bacterium RIFCSPHIGHO2_02_FULL_46_19]|uniref:Uncharacterized protein n=2 Tax=Candidatus Yanofskyibacteriota TaxID=1752733 RepID=A0A1F8H4J8_9BACT|nr:MAG: hypothetical protein A3C81_03070 [Candidatus Yanofskybacteria bacterium RIFCSPHIGHO2_02_FULL_46_19]OGN27080.1 MAG: hypothetical protein A3B17_02115 [Candidatus Yanofskybacteria bacterium RIFCSPLOWO2_01_FULL_45_72]OGN32501.1 MAG: hypothetical protein A3J01_02695 [Candidatus Yanofskybacteria bacterium RIFCSPLOWO2_02_FULL_45_18]
MNLKRYWIGAGSSSGKGGAGIRTQSEFKKTSGSPKKERSNRRQETLRAKHMIAEKLERFPDQLTLLDLKLMRFDSESGRIFAVLIKNGILTSIELREIMHIFPSFRKDALNELVIRTSKEEADVLDWIAICLRFPSDMHTKTIAKKMLEALSKKGQFTKYDAFWILRDIKDGELTHIAVKEIKKCAHGYELDREDIFQLLGTPLTKKFIFDIVINHNYLDKLFGHAYTQDQKIADLYKVMESVPEETQTIFGIVSRIKNPGLY